ncbi:PQQ-dependent sugar dehydrogenase [Clostridium sp. YIM B02551]|uniref:PQQ-dependent sugar dehydrogenase n=1 Tax=Clostridium sp. YIM B02551 TaxID=2910679 RepID=UPI001EEBF75B|nr:PQQ-dependent sugar dehydrogenase [Clostridium sp. YIM B02551]
MKRFITLILLACVISVGTFFIYKISREKVKLSVSNGYEYKIIAKGQQGAKAICEDENNNIYIAFKSAIKIINEDGNEKQLYEDSSLDIYSIVYKDGKLYFVSGSSLMELEIESKKVETLMNNLPNTGEYNESKLVLKDNKIYVTIGAATNSGVVSDDELVKDAGIYDKTPLDITLSGINYDQTGAFAKYGTETKKNEVVKGVFPGNASIIYYDLSNKNKRLYAWGIRNIEGIDFNSKGEIYAVVGGMEPVKPRPIYGDVDYVYKIEKDMWYGWPDFSGGDSVDSSRFGDKDSEKTQLLLSIHPSKNPPAPFFQSKNLSSLTALAIDKNEIIFPKDSIIFFDKKENKVFTLSKEGVLNSYISLKGNGEINDIKVDNTGVIMLEKNQGTIFQVFKENNQNAISFSKKLLMTITFILLIFIVTIIIKLKLTKEVK